MKKGKLIEFYFYVAIFIIGIAFIINSVTITKADKPIISKNKLISEDINYQVYLEENTAIPVEYLEMDKMYVSKLIDYIKFNYNLEYDTDDELSYTVTGRMEVDYLSTNSTSIKPTVAERDYTFISETLITSESETKKLNRTVDIDYNQYNKELASIKEVLGLAVESSLDIILTVNNKTENKTLYTSTISIPLDKEAFTIENTSKDSNIVTGGAAKDSVSVSSPQLLVGILIIIISGMKAFKVADRSFNLVKENYYTLSREKILRTYGDIIAEMAEPIDISGINIADVKNFDQLVDVEEETRSPINFYEVEKNEEGHFVIIHNNIGYRYVLKNTMRKR